MDINSKIDELIGLSIEEDKIASEKSTPAVHDFKKTAGLLEDTATEMVEKTSSPLVKLANEQLGNTEQFEKEAYKKLIAKINPWSAINKGERSLKKTQNKIIKDDLDDSRRAMEAEGKNVGTMSRQERVDAIRNSAKKTTPTGMTTKQKVIAGGAAAAVGDVADVSEKITGKEKPRNTFIRNTA